MTKTLGIINSNNKNIIFAIEKYFVGKDVVVKIINPDYDLSEFDLIALTGFENNSSITHDNILNVYPTLLPSFKNEDNPVLSAYLEGVKVSGITVHKVKKNNFYDKILAQYPVLIGMDTHIENISDELLQIAQKIYPIVIESVLNNQVFDFSDLYNKSSCNGGCDKCKGCH